MLNKLKTGCTGLSGGAHVMERRSRLRRNSVSEGEEKKRSDPSCAIDPEKDWRFWLAGVPERMTTSVSEQPVVTISSSTLPENRGHTFYFGFQEEKWPLRKASTMPRMLRLIAPGGEVLVGWPFTGPNPNLYASQRDCHRARSLSIVNVSIG